MHDPRSRILIFASAYLPGTKAGGPIRTLHNLIDALSDEYAIRLVTSDRDLGSAAPYPDVPKNQWIKREGGHVFYSSPKYRFRHPIWMNLLSKTSFDILYLNSLFDPVYTGRVLLGARALGFSSSRVILAPRGELAPSALQIRRFKKIPALFVMRRSSNFRKINWHATGAHEADDINSNFGRDLNVHIASNISQGRSEVEIHPAPSIDNGGLRVVFVGRIAQMKNLDFALKVLSKCRFRGQFDIYGPVEDLSYWRLCQNLIQDLPPNITVNYCGELPRDGVVKCIASYDLLFLPTRGENFGHVIVEALSAGTPVLISDKTPWRNLDYLDAGWDLSLSEPSCFVKVMERFSILPRVERDSKRIAARRFYESAQESGDAVNSTRKMFNSVLQLH